MIPKVLIGSDNINLCVTNCIKEGPIGEITATCSRTKVIPYDSPWIWNWIMNSSYVHINMWSFLFRAGRFYEVHNFQVKFDEEIEKQTLDIGFLGNYVGMFLRSLHNFYWLHFDSIVRIFKPYFHKLLTSCGAELSPCKLVLSQKINANPFRNIIIFINNEALNTAGNKERPSCRRLTTN
uniref:Uncharacterized protein n=1 Tax=Glossina austeni TaxID=7395 RepID=A0A1A9VP47_GLOAU